MDRLPHFLQNILYSFLDLIIPPSDIESMDGETFTRKAGHTPQLENLPSYAQSLFSYRDPLVRRAVWELKYRGNKKIASLFGTLLYEEMLAQLDEMGIWGKKKIILIPIPSSAKRLQEKGFNQTHLLCNTIRKLDSEKMFFIDTETLVKKQHTKTQVSIRDRSTRLKNLIGAFSLSENHHISGSTIFLIDDVTTTGGTLTEARKVLLEAGAKKVFAFVLAH